MQIRQWKYEVISIVLSFIISNNINCVPTQHTVSILSTASYYAPYLVWGCFVSKNSILKGGKLLPITKVC